MPDPVTFESQSPRHGLPFLFAGQAQKEFFVNESFARIDMLLHAVVEGESNDPPPAPEAGECWIVGPAANGAWAGQEGKLAGFATGDWAFATPLAGLSVWDKSLDRAAIYRNGWTHALEPTPPASGAVIDAEARTAIAEIVEALRNAGIFPAS